MTEGRRALLARLGAIESGAECERWLPALSALADHEATPELLAELRPHLRTCPACRARVRELRELPSVVAAVVPTGLVPLAVGDRAPVIVGHVEAIVHAVLERAGFAVMRAQSALDAVSGTKVAAVAASTAALAGGGVAIQQAAVTTRHHARPQADVAVVGAAAPAAAAGIAVGSPLPGVPSSPRGATTPDVHLSHSRKPKRSRPAPEFGPSSRSAKPGRAQTAVFSSPSRAARAAGPALAASAPPQFSSKPTAAAAPQHAAAAAPSTEPAAEFAGP